MQIGAYSFGDTPLNDDGSPRTTAEAIRNLHEAIVHADRVGLDYFAVGEHHTVSMPASSPGTVIAARGRRDEADRPRQRCEHHRHRRPGARVPAVRDRGCRLRRRSVEITAGRGSSVETFPLFGYDLRDYDDLYAQKLDLLMTINESTSEEITWSGTVRPALDALAVVPRPVRGRLPMWLATGGNAASSVRAGRLGLPIAYGIIGGEPHRFAPLADLYRRSAAQAGRSGDDIKVSVGALGLIAPTKQEAMERFYPGWHNLNVEMGRLRGWAPPERRAFEAQAQPGGAYYVGDPDEIAQRIVHLQQHMGHMRHFLQMDIGGLPQEHFLESLTSARHRGRAPRRATARRKETADIA